MRIAAGVLVALALVTAGCANNHDGEYVAVCTDRQGNRVTDDRCDRGDSNFIWYYLLWNASRPPIGTNVHHYNYGSSVPRGYAPLSTRPPTAKKVQTGVPLKGYTPPAAKPQAPKVQFPQRNSGGFNKAPNPAPRYNPPPKIK